MRVYKNVVQSCDIKIENLVKTGHKAAESIKRKEMQFRPVRFIEPRVYFTCCFFLHIYPLLQLEIPLITELQNSSHVRKEKEQPIMEPVH